MEGQLQSLSEENQKLRRELAAQRRQLSDPSRINSQNNDNTASSTGSNESPQADEDANAARLTSPSRSPSSDAFSLEVGYLSLKATGETRYVGSSSGMGLASIIDSVVESQGANSLVPLEQREPDGPGAQIAHVTPSDASFPPLSVAMPFIKAYFEHTHITFPILHQPSFLRTVEKIYSETDYYTTHPFESFAFDMVLAIGSSNFNRFEESTAGTAVHYARAQAKLPQVLNMKGLIPLKTIIFLSQHGIFSNLRDTSASIWHLVGIGVRICFELGLHLEPRHLDGQHGTAPHVVKVVSFTLGRPAALRDSDIDVSLPSHLDDESFGPDRPILQEPHCEGNPGPNISPFLHLIRIRRLSGEILSTFYSAKQGANIFQEEKERVRRTFYEELISWRNDTQLLNLAERCSDKGVYVSSFLTPEWYTAVFNNAMLLLYRPSPFLPHPTAMTGMGTEERDHVTLFSAAKDTITAYSELHRKRRLNYSWITLHGVFIAGLAYVYGVGRALKDSRQTMPIPDYLNIINDTRACSNVLVAICERWNVARRSCELFNKLSNAVIRDAINAAASRGSGASCGNAASSQMPGDHPHKRASSSAGPMGAPNEPAQPYDFSNPMGLLGPSAPMEHVSVIDEFRQYSTAFENIFAGDQSFPSELVTGFSQDWTFDDPFANQDDSAIQMQEHAGLW
ncbi:MAG: hypothetical protein M1818_001340 [Claussenomyces sp. TS43310]|nr:MAG: hypothetical protein M1818_001340 [Claussenomyces sp. TS43310]